VASGQNTDVPPDDLESVIGDDTLADLQQKTGMSRAKLLAALSQNLPRAVDTMTPNGRLPTADEAGSYV